MSFTKVAPAGIGTEPGDGYRIGNSFLHSTGLNVSGIITATEGGTVAYYGDGSNLTGIDATAIKHTDGNVKVQAINTGANLTGNLSVSGNLGVGGVLTYEDVTNIDSVGVITARSGIQIGVGGTIGSSGGGIVTYFGDGSQLTGIDATKIETGNTKLETIDTGSDGHIKVTTEGTERLRIKNDGKLNITPGGALSGGHPPGDLNIVGTNFITMTPNDNANASDNEVLGHIAFLPYGAGSIGAASAKIEAVAESGQSGSSNATSMRFYTKPSSAGPGNSGTERMRITPEGYVTKPNNLCLQYTRNSSNYTSGTIIYDTEVFDVGDSNAYNTSNGEFTAPVTGIYRIQYEHFSAGAGRATCAIEKDTGSGFSQVKRGMRIYSQASGSDWASVPTIFYMQMNATNKFRIVHNEGTVHLNNPWNHLTVQLVQ